MSINQNYNIMIASIFFNNKIIIDIFFDIIKPVPINR